MELILCSANNPVLTYSPSMLKYLPRILRRRLNTFRAFSVGAYILKYFLRILRGSRKNEEYAEKNILGWKGLVPLMFKILGKSNLRDIYGHK